MDVIILGKNTDDKGAQLERLTASIPRKMGYENVSTNEIGAGGNEIDVVAEFTQPGIKGTNKRTLLCECKAHKEPISTTDWMKFLGKIFTNELGGKNIDGCFIALNGANGNVKGQYKELLNHRDNIQLVTGDDLINVLKELFQLKAIEHVQLEISSQTGRNILSTSICYYADKIYWVVVFIDYSYSILTHKGEIISDEDSPNLQNLISLNTDWTTFVDLKKENLRRQRVLFVEKSIISVFLLQGRKILSSELLTLCDNNLGNHPIKAFDELELEEAIQSLKEKGIVIDQNGILLLKILSRSPNLL